MRALKVWKDSLAVYLAFDELDVIDQDRSAAGRRGLSLPSLRIACIRSLVTTRWRR